MSWFLKWNKVKLIHFFERKLLVKDVASVSKWLTSINHHRFSFNFQMCMSQKISWYKFVCRNTTLISLPTPPAISDYWNGIRKKALREALGWSSLCYYVFYITNIFPVTILSKLNELCSVNSLSQKPSFPPPMLLIFFVALLRTFLFISLTF